MRSITQSLTSIYGSCKSIMMKIMEKALGGCGEVLKVLAAIMGILMTLAMILGCAVCILPIWTFASIGDKLSPEPSQVQA